MCWRSNKILQIHRVSHDNHQNYGSTNNFPQSPGCPCFHKWWRSPLPHGSDYLLPASARKRSQQKHTTIICCDFQQLLQTSDLKFTIKGFPGHQGIPSISSQPKIHRVLSSGESTPFRKRVHHENLSAEKKTEEQTRKPGAFAFCWDS